MRALFLLCSFAGIAGPLAAQQQEPTVSEWEADIDSLVSMVSLHHALPFHWTSRDSFQTAIANLKARLPGLSHTGRITALMRTYALLGHGHSIIEPFGEHGFHGWYPIHLHRFADGLFVTAVDTSLADLAGARVLMVEEWDAITAAEAASALMAADNEFTARERTYFLSSPDALVGLGIRAARGPMRLTVRTRAGVERRVDVPILEPEQMELNWRFGGEVFMPLRDRGITAFGLPIRSHLDLDQTGGLPLFVRSRQSYWFEHLPAQHTVYFQFNGVHATSPRSEESLQQLVARMFSVIDDPANAITRVIIDVRWNSGGNGALVGSLVREFIKREDQPFAQAGHLFLLTGPKTYSAAVIFVAAMREHTEAILVGEPMGAPLNDAGNPLTFVLPRTGLTATIGTEWEQHGLWSDRRRVIPVQVAAPMTGAAYVAGRDPALEAVLSAPVPYPTVMGAMQRGDTSRARALLTAAIDEDTPTWWEPFSYGEMNSLAYERLREGRTAEGVVAFELNAGRYPLQWEAWDGLGDGYAAAGRHEDAVRAYRHALAIAPDNWNRDFQKAQIQRLERLQ